MEFNALALKITIEYGVQRFSFENVQSNMEFNALALKITAQVKKQ